MNWSWDKSLSILKGAGLAAAGAGLAYLSHWATGIDPMYSGLVGAALSVAANVVRKLGQDNEA